MKFWIIISLLSLIGILFITYLLYSYYTRSSDLVEKKNVTFKVPEATIMNSQNDDTTKCECKECPDGTKATWDKNRKDCCAYSCTKV